MEYAAFRQFIPISLVIIALLPGVPTGAAGGAGSPAPLSKGWGRFLASGIVSGVDPGGRTMTLAIAGQGRLETFEGQDRWRSQPARGTQVVHLVPATVISDAGDEPATISAIRTGAPATVWGAVRPDSSVFGLKVVMAPSSTRSFTARSTGAPYALVGTVLGRSGGTIELLTPQGIRRSVIATGATTVQSATGSTVPLSAIDRYDVVRVEGTVNSDGSVAAIRIDVDLEAADAAQVSGAVDQVFGEVEGLVVGGVMVPIPSGCYFIKGAGPGAFRLLIPGQAVTVYGMSIAVGSTPIGLRARVVVAR
jgi:hypothetical protein